MKKLRVLHLIPNLKKGGAERYAVDVCNELVKIHDIEVKLITLSYENAYSFITDDLPISCINSKYIPSISGKSIIDKEKYVSLLNDFRPHIIHTHLFRAELFSSSFLSTSAVYVTHCHDNMHQYRAISPNILFSKKKITEYYEKYLLLKNKYRIVRNYFIANSDDTLSYFQKVLPNKMKKDVELIEIGFDFNRFFNSDFPKPEISEKIQIVMVGSFADKKNQKLLVEVASVLKSRGVKFEINMLGDGLNRKKIQKLIYNYGLEDFVFLRGNVDNVEEYLWKSNLYVHTAWYEPFGLAFLEAMAAGLPCVSLDGKGNRSLIKDGFNGYFIKEQNPELFADKIETIANSPLLYSQMVLNAISCAKQYDISLKTRELVDFYRKITAHS